MPESDQPLSCHVSDYVATITLERPDALNALNVAMLEELGRTLARYQSDTDVRAVVLTGTGRAFCAGGDLRDLSSYGARKGDGFRYGAGVFHQTVLAMRALPKPIVAAIQGVAAGGGMSLAFACDLRVMADSTFMQVGYVGRGLSPDGGLSYFLPRLVSPAKALELALLDERLGAAECLELGLVNEVVPEDQVAPRAQEMAHRLSRGPGMAMARAKMLMSGSGGLTLAEQLERERLSIAECADSPEGDEGLRSFIEKRAPDFLSLAKK